MSGVHILHGLAIRKVRERWTASSTQSGLLKVWIKPDAKAVGKIVRYGDGPTSLMQITSMSGGRFYGNQIFGGSVGADRSQLRLPSEADRKMWRDKMDERWKINRMQETYRSRERGNF